jgi:hypothetical protein
MKTCLSDLISIKKKQRFKLLFWSKTLLLLAEIKILLGRIFLLLTYDKHI